MADRLARHDVIVRDAVARHAGHVFATGGDGFAIAFHRAGDALDAAVEVQRALHDAGLASVRMGANTGEAVERDGDYFGPAVIRAARLMAIAHGGQIVLSSAASRLVSGVELVDLGEHHLPNLSEPERVFQLVAPGIRREFPPLRSVSSDVRAIPMPLSSFVGRATEVEELGRRVRPGVMLTITGAGGCGKTRLAVEVARRRAGQFAQGAVLVDLAPLSDPTAVGHAVSSALGIVARDGAEVSDVVAWLAPRSLVLVLDTCEHLLDACAAICERVMTRCSSVAVIATSREPLHVHGELIWRVPSLAISESFELFRQRASAVQHDFALSPADRSSVDEICTRLDGIPLAIELAAALVDHLSPAEIAARLDDRFRLLRGSRRGIARQQTLGAALQWSYDLLDEPSRLLLRRLSVFPGNFSVEGVEAVCADEALSADVVLELVGSLVGRSLVSATPDDGATKYRLLETIRLFARERLLESGEAPAVSNRHADRCIDVLARTGRCAAEAWSRVTYTRVDVSLDDLRSALDWLAGSKDQRAGTLVPLAVRVFNDHARHDEALEWLDAMLQLPDLARTTQVDLLAARSSALMNATRYEEAATDAARAIQIAAPTPELVTAYYNQALVLFGRDPSRSDTISALQRAIDELEPMFSTPELSRLRPLGEMLYGEAALLRGDVTDARRILEGHLDHLDRPSLLALAVAYVVTGDPAHAVELLGNGRTVPGPHLFFHLFSAHEVPAYAALGDRDAAAASARRCLAELADFTAFNGQPDLLTALAGSAYWLDQLPQASTLLEVARRAGGLHGHGTIGLWRWLARQLVERLPSPEREAARTTGAVLDPTEAIARGIQVIDGSVTPT